MFGVIKSENDGGVADGFEAGIAHLFYHYFTTVSITEQPAFLDAGLFSGGDDSSGGAGTAGTTVLNRTIEQLLRLKCDRQINKTFIINFGSPLDSLRADADGCKTITRAVMGQICRSYTDNTLSGRFGYYPADSFAKLNGGGCRRHYNGYDFRLREKMLNKRYLDFDTVLGIVDTGITDGQACLCNRIGKLLVYGNLAERGYPAALSVNRRFAVEITVGSTENYEGIDIFILLFDRGKNHCRQCSAEGPAGMRHYAGGYFPGQRPCEFFLAETNANFIEAGGFVRRIKLTADYRLSALHLLLPVLALFQLIAYTFRTGSILKKINLKSEKKMAAENKTVAVVMGSDSDMDVMQSCIKQLEEFAIEPEVRIISAHRTPEAASEFAQNAAEKGIKVIIAAAGMAAHLAGVLAAKTTLPVIGVPLVSGSGLEGIDAFLSTAQMPPGVPVATVAIGKAGAKNAAILAVQILALSDKKLAKKLVDFKKKQEQKVLEKDANLKRD